MAPIRAFLDCIQSSSSRHWCYCINTTLRCCNGSIDHINNISSPQVPFNPQTFEATYSTRPPLGDSRNQVSRIIWNKNIRMVALELCLFTMNVINNIGTIVSTEAACWKGHCKFSLSSSSIFNTESRMSAEVLMRIRNKVIEPTPERFMGVSATS